MRVLHVGMPKAGSTALQGALARAGLLANANAAGDGKEHRWGMEAAGFEFDNEFLMRRRALRMVPSGPVLSDESLCLAEPPVANYVKATYAPDRTLLVVRPFAAAAESWWRQAVSGGETMPFPDWCESVLFADPVTTPEARWCRPDYVSWVWRPDDVWDWTTTLVRNFNLAYFPDYVMETRRENVSLSPEATEALRRAQEVYPVGWALIQQRVRSLAAVDTPSARLMSDESRYALTRYSDEALWEGAVHRTLAHLKPMPVTVRPLNENTVRALLAQIGEV